MARLGFVDTDGNIFHINQNPDNSVLRKKKKREDAPAMAAVSQTVKPTQTVKTTINTVNADGYTETNKKYGDYKYQDYANKKDYKVYKKDGKSYYYNENTKQYVDMDTPTMTSAEQDKKDYNEAVKQGFKGKSIYQTKETSKLTKEKQDKFGSDSKNKSRSLSTQTLKSKEKQQVLPTKIADRVELDTSDLSKEEKQKYAKDLIRQEKDRDKDLSYVRRGGAGLQGTIGELQHTTRNIDENFVEPLARAPESYDYGKLAQQQSLEYYKAMMGQKNNLAEINKKIEKYNKFNKDIIDSKNEIDSYFKNLPNQIGGMKAGIENAGILGAAGGIVGGGLGAIATRTPQGALAAAQTGAKLLGGAGYVKGQAENTFKLEAGATYQTLLDMGVPEDIAKQEAMRVGTENALIESGESLVDLLTLGKGSVAIDKLKDGLIKKYGVDFVKNLGKSYVANVASEGLEEGTQEQRTIAGEKRAANRAGIERDDSQDVNRILQSAKSGAIAAGISGGATRTLGMTGGSTMKTVSNAAMTRVQNLNPVEREALTEVTQKIKRGEQLDEQDMGVIGVINSKPIETVEETQPIQEAQVTQQEKNENKNKLPHSSKINEVGYHASNQTFDTYDTSKIGTGQGDNTQGKGINLASVKEAVDGVYGKNTYETNINLENAYTVDDKKLLSTFEKDFGYKTDMDNISDELQKKGYDGIVINVNGNKLYTVFDKKNLEIKNNKNTEKTNKLTNDEIEELKNLKNLPFEDEESDKRIDELLIKQDESLKNQMSPVRDLNEVRNYEDMGNKKINAYQYDNPEVKPYFEVVADDMLKELDNATRGEKFVTEDGTWKGQQRVISDDLAELLDGENGTKYSYEDIRKGLKAIIEDAGAENKAVSKRIEFYIDQRLRNGYKDYLGYDVPKNTKYLDTLRDKMYEGVDTKEAEENKNDSVEIKDDSISNENIPAEKEETVLKFKNPQEEKQYFKDAGYDDKIAEVLTSNRKQKSSVKETANEIAGEFYRKLVAKGGELERISELTDRPQVKNKFDRSLRAESEAQQHLSEAQADYNLKPYTNFKDADGNKTSMSFDDIRKAVKKDKIPEKDFNTYLLHKLNEYRYPQGKPVFGDAITDDISKEEIAKLEEKYKNIEHHAENVWTFEQNQLKNDYEAGLITENVYKNLAKNEHYIRMQREVPSKGKMGLSVDKKGNITVNSPIQTAKGGNQDIKPVMENIAQNTIDRVKLARTNQSIKELAKAVGVGSKDSEISAITDEESFGINPELVKKNEDGTYTITYFDNGIATTLPVNKAIYEAYSRNKYIDTIRNNPLYKAVFYAPKKVNRLFKNVVTTYSPTFLVKNAARDIGDAPVNSKYTREFLKNYSTFQSQKDILTGGPYTQLYKAAGGIQDSYFYNGTFADKRSKVSKAKEKILSPLERANEIVETVPRLTEFMATFKANGYEVTEDGIVPIKDKKQNKTAEEVLDEALYNSAEITVNFKRKGDITAFLDESGATFLSASVAGFDKQIRNFKNAFSSGDKKQIVKLLTKAAMFGIAPTLINDALHGDEEEYKDLPEYQKDNYYLLRGKGWYQLPNKDVYIRIPKGRAMSVIGSAYRRTKDYTSGKKDAYNGFLKFAADQVAPNSVFSNNIASPYFAVKNNKAWSGNEIVPSYMQRKKNKWKEYNSGTDEFSKWLGKKINKSPMKINYLIDQYTGGVGDLVLPNITQKVRGKKDLLHNPATNPFIDAFSTNAVYSNKNQGEFYDMKDITGEDYEDLESNIDGARYNYLSGKGKEMAALNAEINRIQSSNLSNNEKYEKVTELKRQINKIAKDALKEAKNAKQVSENEFVVGGTHYMKQNGEMKSIKPEKLQEANDLGLSISVWSDISSYKGKARADKDENGESIRGTAKQKVIDYVYSKEELTEAQKKQILEQLYSNR